ncbi:hypothetical protein [Cupriavidus metallidurans]|uniref:hypothetical protein n=1 Tax=Cupriavidus metallidurans TaxID=119219 RepID=UPI0016462E16|nr:hypothetical protein [Cupriavidus metallidurans]
MDDVTRPTCPEMIALGETAMKTKRRQRLIGQALVGGGMLLSLIAGVVHAQERTSAYNAANQAFGPQTLDRRASYQSAAPLSADALMENLLLITASQEGRVKKHSVEQIFETKLPYKKDVTVARAGAKEAHGIWYYARPGQDWQYNLGVAEYSNGDSWFGFSFASELEGPAFNYELTNEIRRPQI